MTSPICPASVPICQQFSWYSWHQHPMRWKFSHFWSYLIQVGYNMFIIIINHGFRVQIFTFGDISDGICPGRWCFRFFANGQSTGQAICGIARIKVVHPVQSADVEFFNIFPWQGKRIDLEIDRQEDPSVVATYWIVGQLQDIQFLELGKCAGFHRVNVVET